MQLSREAIVAGALIAAFAALNTLYLGYDFGSNSYHAMYFPLVHSLSDPALYPNDLYLTHLSKMPSFFWHTVAWLSSAYGLKNTLFWIYALSRILLACAVVFVCRRIFGCFRTGAVALILICFSRFLNMNSLFGQDPLLSPYADHATFGWSAGILCLALWMGNKDFLAFGLLGVLANFNAMSAVHVLLIIMSAKIMGGFYSREIVKRELWKHQALCLAIFCAAVSPILARKLKTGASFGLEAMRTLIQIQPLGYVASNWPWTYYFEAASAGIFLVVLTRWSRRNGNCHEKIHFVFPAVLVWWSLGFLFAGIFNVPAIVGLQFFRNGVVVLWLQYVFTAGWIVRRWQEWDMAGALAAGVCLWACLFAPHKQPVLYFWSIAILFFAESARWSRNSLKPVMGGGFLFCLAALEGYFDDLVFLHLEPTTAFVGAALSGLALCVPSKAQFSSAGVKWFVFGAILFVCAVPFLEVAAWHLVGPEAISLKNKRVEPESLVGCILKNTPKDALFAVTPWDSRLIAFRALTRRPCIAEWTDFTALNWSPSFAGEYRSRLVDLGLDWNGFVSAKLKGDLAWSKSFFWDTSRGESPAPGSVAAKCWSKERLIFLAKKYSASYAVSGNECALGLPVVCRAGNFSVYRLGQ